MLLIYIQVNWLTDPVLVIWRESEEQQLDTTASSVVALDLSEGCNAAIHVGITGKDLFAWTPLGFSPVDLLNKLNPVDFSPHLGNNHVARIRFKETTFPFIIRVWSKHTGCPLNLEMHNDIQPVMVNLCISVLHFGKPLVSPWI